MILKSQIDALTFENQVGCEIQKCLDYRKEEIVTGYLDNHVQGFDFILDKGCKALNWPAQTHVEVKLHIIYDSLFRINHQLKNCPEIKKLVVIVRDKIGLANANLFARKKIIKRRLEHRIENDDDLILDHRIELIWFDDFVQMVKKRVSNANSSQDHDLKDFNSQENIIAAAKKIIKEGNVSLFLGAGVSASAGVGNWDNLLCHLTKARGIRPLNGVADNVVQGRYLIDLYKNNFNDLTQDVKSFLYQNLKKSALITSIAGIIKQCNVESVVTYNYDDLLETELGVYSNNVCYPIYGLSRVPNGVKTPIYHVHGYLPRTKNGASSIIVLGEKEYHDIYRESNNWGSVEQLHALNRNVCFFIGLSMTDPNLRRLLDLSAGNDSEVGRVHFVFLIREPSRPGYESFMERTMRDFGINCIWYNNHNDLPSLLNDLLT